MLFSVNRLVSASLSNISVGWGGGRWGRPFTLFWAALIWICWNETGRAWGSQIALWYPYITGWDCVSGVCMCLCVNLFKSIRCLYIICTSINLHCSLCFCFPLFFSLPHFDSVPWLPCAILISAFAFVVHPLPFIHSFAHLSIHLTPSQICLSLSFFQCIRHIATLLLQNQPSLLQPALKLMSESGDEQLLQLTLDQINGMSTVSVTVIVWRVCVQMETQRSLLYELQIGWWHFCCHLSFKIVKCKKKKCFTASWSSRRCSRFLFFFLINC